MLIFLNQFGHASQRKLKLVQYLFIFKYLSKCPILSELLTPVSAHKDAFWSKHKAHTLLPSLPKIV